MTRYRYTSVSICAFDDDNRFARICLKACTRWECNGERIDEIKRPRGVDRKIERGPLSSQDGGGKSRRESGGRPESCKWYERGRERVRETECKEGKDKRGGREL